MKITIQNYFNNERKHLLTLFLQYNNIEESRISILETLHKQVVEAVIEFLEVNDLNSFKSSYEGLIKKNNLNNYERLILLSMESIYVVRFLNSHRKTHNKQIRLIIPLIGRLSDSIEQIKINKSPIGLYTISLAYMFCIYEHNSKTDKKRYIKYNFENIRLKKNAFEIDNRNHYNLKGEIIKEAINPNDYDINNGFINLIKEIDYVYNIPNLLNFHYRNTKDKDRFIKHIQYHIGASRYINEEVKEQIDIWLKNDKETLSHKEDLRLESLKNNPSKTAINCDWQKLTKSLIDNNFLDEDTPSDALQIFFDNHTPQQKTKWIDKAKNKAFTKHSLFVLIEHIDNYLMDKEDRKILYTRIENHFTDGNDTVFTTPNLKSSLSSWQKRKMKSGNNNRETVLIKLIDAAKIK